ncbi:type II secretion system protein [Colwellia psychrerythraea]|uniref:MSHA pilin protein MshC n=1 Tax=Colwellia psychrerythraea (strain 34H / ATCC BAA-681) TaxID=167879 RepID=Q47VF6_COLP3|nr:type II secretion system protein [Colwellia psychrerythraea]AAZ26905.1 MSHA pilin protein MshC [Colwellia psychrerythraea 34H]
MSSKCSCNLIHQGFTLVELVTVILLISILAVSVAPKFGGTASYEAHTHRAKLISALRLTQQRAMQQTDTADGYCHQLVFDNDSLVSRYGIPDRVDCTVTTFSGQIPEWQPDATGFEVELKYQVSFGIQGKNNPSAITFDSMGRPVSNATLANNCVGGCIINIQSSVETLRIQIESEGYIHAI